MDRRRFLTLGAPVTILLANGQWVRAAEGWYEREAAGKVKLRFAVASDGHYGQPKTDYAAFFDTLVQKVNAEHARKPFAFTMINGDIIHDDPTFFAPAKQALHKLGMKYYVSQGNHDHCSADDWQKIWNMPVNLDFSIRRNSFLVATTSNEKGEYLCPDLQWMEQRLQAHRRQENIFIFLHINPAGQTANAVTCDPLSELFARHRNIRAVFNGHDHDQDGVKVKNGIPYIFDAHFGGSWGTSYRGFRVVELLNDQRLVTYILNPDQKMNETELKATTA